MNLVKFCKQHQIVLLATIIGLIAASIYYFSGKSSLDNSTRQLTTDQSVEKVDIKESGNGQKTAEIKCQNGESYEVYYPPGETDYRSIAASKCSE
ncbi:hypothetical protein IT412_05755 [Candidatus Peregrinibacteria bacterium]|nr:hypothetical protein [Candidatus Peregrinibacteria bacterium]